MILNYCWMCNVGVTIHYYTEAYSQHCQTSEMECFAKIVNGWKAFTIFPKQLTLDVWQGSEYASVVCPCNFSNTSLNNVQNCSHKFSLFQLELSNCVLQPGMSCISSCFCFLFSLAFSITHSHFSIEARNMNTLSQFAFFFERNSDTVIMLNSLLY